MSHLRVIINGQTLMDANPGEWTHTPPDLTKLNFNAGAIDQPYMLTIQGIVAKRAIEAIAGHTQGNTEITVTTRTNGWDMSTTTT